MPDSPPGRVSAPDPLRVLPLHPADPPVIHVAGTAPAHTPLADATDVAPPPGATRRNFAILLAQGSTYGLAGKLASTSIVLPFLCAALGGSLLVAGLLVPLGTVGTLVGYTLGPTVLSTRLPSRVVMALTSSASAALLFALAGVSLLLPDRAAAIDITFVGVALGTGLTSGIGSIAFTDILGRGVDPARRSNLLLTQAAVGGALASVVAVVSAWVFSSRSAVVGHVSLEWFAGGFLLLSAACCLFVGVEHVPARPGSRRSLTATLRDGAAAARRYPWLRAYLVRQVLFLSVALATTFFSIRAATLHAGTQGSLSLVIAVTSSALVVGAVLWQRVLTRSGFRGMLVGGTALSALAAAGAVVLERLGLSGVSPWTHAVIMLLATLAADAVSVGKSAYLVGHAPAAELPELSAFSQLTIGLASAVLAAAIAALAEVHGATWPAVVLLLLNLVAVVAASRVPPPSRGGSAA